MSKLTSFALLTGALMMTATAAAADLKLLASTAVKTVLDEVIAPYEKASGHRIDLVIGSSAAIMARLKAGETPDMVILTAEGIDELIAQGKVERASRSEIAKAGLGLAVKRGAAKPDIATVEAFKRTLLDAPSIVYTESGASGLYFAKLLDRLGIAAAVKPKAIVLKSGLAGDVVARGDAQLGVQMVSEILAVPAAELVGPFPAEIQNNMVFTAGTLAGSANAATARSLADYLRTPAVGAVFKAKGLEPAAR